MKGDLEIGGISIPRGQSRQVNLFVAKLYDHTDLNIAVRVVRGKGAGPILFLSSTIHGDEINGIEIIKRLLQRKEIQDIKGSLIAVPIVNVFGFNTRSRYLPDRRDLNRCFPGVKEGSLASRMADLFFSEVVQKATHGIDIHSGALHRSNLPQIRIDIENSETFLMARAFGAPVILNSSIRDGSLRQAAADAGIPVLLYEAGEALRINEYATRLAVKGILSVMREIGMLPNEKAASPRKVFLAKSSHWIRASGSGTLTFAKRLGSTVQTGELLGTISNPFGEDQIEVRAKRPGIILGSSKLPLVNRGDALFHIGTVGDEVVEDDFAEVPASDLDQEIVN